MSGGSFNHLFAKSPEELIRAEAMIEAMAAAPADLGYAPDAARETRIVNRILGAYRSSLTRKLRRLERVWQAVEYWKSGEWTEQDVRDAIDEYRRRHRRGTHHAPTKPQTDGGAG